MNKFEFGRKDILAFAHEKNYSLNNVEKVIRLSLLLDDLNSLPEFKGKFVLKGGTAINLVIFDLPRLSVDIDLDFAENSAKDEMLREREEINRALEDYFEKTGYAFSRRSSYSLDAHTLSYRTTSDSGDKIKLDINYYNRCHIYTPLFSSISFPFGARNENLSVLHLQIAELFAGKIKALYERAKPRDIYDVYRLAKSNLIGSAEDINNLRICLAFYSVLSNTSRLLDKDITAIRRMPISAVKTQLLPMLPNGIFYPKAEIDDVVIEFLQTLKLKPEEKLFIDKFYEGEYLPELLFDKPTADKLAGHPVAIRIQEQLK
jgi:predicted nucleotidyltransferase component of viral defense system